MRNFRAGKPTTGGTPDSKLREAFREKLPKSGGAFFTPEQRHILELFGVIGDVLPLEMNACLPGCVWNATPRSLSPLERNIGFWTQA